MALGKKIGQGHLFQQRKVHIDEAARREKALEQLGGSDQVAQAQGGKEHFAKSPDIYHAPGAIQALQRLQGPPAEAILAIIVVLYDPGLRLSAPFQQRQPPAQAHGDSGGELVRRGDDGKPRLRAELLPGLDIDALLVNWHRNQFCSGGQECPTCSRIPRIFDPGQVARIQQHARDQVKGALRAGGEDDLFRRAVHATRDADVRGDSFAQRGVAVRVLVEGDGLQ